MTSKNGQGSDAGAAGEQPSRAPTGPSKVPTGPAPETSRYAAEASRLANQLASLPPGTPVRLAKKTSNLFRTRAGRPSRARASTRKSGGQLDFSPLEVSAFDGVIQVDPQTATAEVLGMTTYEHLVDATLAHGMMPLVVPQLKTITIGGAVSGLGIESSSFRNGMPHESVIEMDILTGAGEVVTARPGGEHAELFEGFPNSYGSLGYALRLVIQLERTEPYVHLRHLRFSSLAEVASAIGEICAAGSYAGCDVHFIDGTVFSPSECYLTLGSWAKEAPYTSDYTYTEIYYHSLRQRMEDWLSVRDYLWRWDTDWFWCSRAFGVQRRWVRRLLGRRFLRSDVYWTIMRFDQTHHLKSRLDKALRLPAQERVVQDVEVPLGTLEEFVERLSVEVPVSPVWLCPLRTSRHPQTSRHAQDPTPAQPLPAQPLPNKGWSLYPLDPDTLYVNVGFWSSVPLEPEMDPNHHNRWVEAELQRLGGHKSLYSTAFYDEATFYELYNGDAYRALKSRYDPGGRFLDLYSKCVRGQ